MASDSEPETQPNGIHNHIRVVSSPEPEPLTPQEELALPESSQITLPSTEIPPSTMDPNESFATEVNDDRPESMVIPSSVTPPPSSAHAAAHNAAAIPMYTNSQQSTLFSPPATIPNTVRDRDIGAKDVDTGYEVPSPSKVLEASSDQLRVMLQNCIVEHHRLKMETAHYKLQNNLLKMQSDEDSKRAEVEYEMMRREVDALRTAEHSRQAKRELSTPSEPKYAQTKKHLEDAVDTINALQRRLRVAKRVLLQKEEETMKLNDERAVLLNRIRENREHMHILRSPGGLFHDAMTPRQNISSPQQHRSTPRQTSRGMHRAEREQHEGGLGALLLAMQDNSSNNNNSAPSTPTAAHRLAPRQVGRHHRNAQSMSSLPTTPMNRPRGEHAGLLPSVDLVPQTEPPQRYSHGTFVPVNHAPRRMQGRKSRESTISAEDNEELARQALKSAAAAQSFVSHASRASHNERARREDQGDDDEEIYDSQASQAATQMLRREARQSFEVASSGDSQDSTPGLATGPADKSARLQARILNNARETGVDKRKFSGNHGAGSGPGEEARHEPGSPSKKMRVGASASAEERRKVGLGIQYSP